MAFIIEVPKDTHSGEPHEWDCDPRIFVNEATVESCEPKEGLDILDFMGFGPILDNLDFVHGHCETFRR